MLNIIPWRDEESRDKRNALLSKTSLLLLPSLYCYHKSVSGLCVCKYVSVTSAIVKCPALPLYMEDGCCANLLLLSLLLQTQGHHF